MSVRSRPLAYLPLLVTVLCLALTVHMAWQDPRYLFPLILILMISVTPAVLARRRMRRLLMSGDVERVLGTWQHSRQRIAFPETMGPLMAATAYASYGWTDAARDALSRAAKGPAWDAALEQRLFIETLLDTFEGDREGALRKANELELMPVAASGPLMRRRVESLRRGLAALARAFAHRSTAQDEKVLDRAASISPLVHWAMRYARAIIAVDRGEKKVVASILAGAPEWPKESAFRIYHEELLSRSN